MAGIREHSPRNEWGSCDNKRGLQLENIPKANEKVKRTMRTVRKKWTKDAVSVSVLCVLKQNARRKLQFSSSAQHTEPANKTWIPKWVGQSGRKLKEKSKVHGRAWEEFCFLCLALYGALLCLFSLRRIVKFSVCLFAERRQQWQRQFPCGLDQLTAVSVQHVLSKAANRAIDWSLRAFIIWQESFVLGLFCRIGSPQGLVGEAKVEINNRTVFIVKKQLRLIRIGFNLIYDINYLCLFIPDSFREEGYYTLCRSSLN